MVEIPGGWQRLPGSLLKEELQFLCQQLCGDIIKDFGSLKHL